MATVKIKYLLRKAGLLYYQRGIPPDLRPHYSGRALILINLKTQDLSRAARLCAQYAIRDDVLWRTLRGREGQSLTTPESRAAAEALLQSWGGSRGLRPRYDDNHPQEVAVVDHIEDYMTRKYGKPYEITCDSVDVDEQLTHPRLDEFYSPIEREAIRLLNETPATRQILLSDALERYLSEHKRGSDPRFARDARRAIGLVTSTIGDFPLGDYTRDHARAVRDALMPGHSTATVRRRLDSICAIFNIGKHEFDIQCVNPFEKLKIAREGLDAVKRLPFSNEELDEISSACLKLDDDIRWLIGIQLATGARLQEIVGLRRDDVILDHVIPHVHIRPNEALGRILKTPGSERVVPLVGIALWGAKQAMGAAGVSAWLFPRYAADGNIRAGSASASINKWIKETPAISKTTHSLRHSVKDLLRGVECPEKISEAILGHGTKSISDNYGQGYRLETLRDWLKRALEPIK